MVPKILIAALLIALAGCTTTRGSFCEIASPIRPSAETIAHLTDAEVRQILALNRKGQKLCGWRP